MEESSKLDILGGTRVPCDTTPKVTFAFTLASTPTVIPAVNPGVHPTAAHSSVCSKIVACLLTSNDPVVDLSKLKELVGTTTTSCVNNDGEHQVKIMDELGGSLNSVESETG